MPTRSLVYTSQQTVPDGVIDGEEDIKFESRYRADGGRTVDHSSIVDTGLTLKASTNNRGYNSRMCSQLREPSARIQEPARLSNAGSQPPGSKQHRTFPRDSLA